MLSYEEAVARITAAGERFEIGQVDVGGVPTRVFANAPRILGEIFAPARQRDGT